MNACCLVTVTLSYFLLWSCFSFSLYTTICQKGLEKKKAKFPEEDSYLKVFPMMEIIYGDMKAITRNEMEFQWEKIYHMIKDKTVRDVG